jgi:hypothetical protein
MKNWVHSLLAASANRWLSDVERLQMFLHTEGLPARLAAARQVAEAEESALRHAADELRRRRPDDPRCRAAAMAAVVPHVTGTLQSAVRTLILDDPVLLDDTLIGFLGRVLEGLGWGPAASAELFALVRDGLKARLSAEAFPLVRPHLNRIAEGLGRAPAFVGRIEAARAVEAVADRVCADASAAVRERFPAAPGRKLERDGTLRDLSASLRWAVQGMLAGEVEVLDRRFLKAARAVLNRNRDDAPEVSAAHAALRDALRRELPAPAFAAVEPFASRLVQVLTLPPQ